MFTKKNKQTNKTSLTPNSFCFNDPMDASIAAKQGQTILIMKRNKTTKTKKATSHRTTSEHSQVRQGAAETFSFTYQFRRIWRKNYINKGPSDLQEINY